MNIQVVKEVGFVGVIALYTTDPIDIIVWETYYHLDDYLAILQQVENGDFTPNEPYPSLGYNINLNNINKPIFYVNDMNIYRPGHSGYIQDYDDGDEIEHYVDQLIIKKEKLNEESK